MPREEMEMERHKKLLLIAGALGVLAMCLAGACSGYDETAPQAGPPVGCALGAACEPEGFMCTAADKKKLLCNGGVYTKPMSSCKEGASCSTPGGTCLDLCDRELFCSDDGVLQAGKNAPACNGPTGGGGSGGSGATGGSGGAGGGEQPPDCLTQFEGKACDSFAVGDVTCTGTLTCDCAFVWTKTDDAVTDCGDGGGGSGGMSSGGSGGAGGAMASGGGGSGGVGGGGGDSGGGGTGGVGGTGSTSSTTTTSSSTSSTTSSTTTTSSSTTTTSTTTTTQDPKCDPNVCDFCWYGKVQEKNCLATWENDGWCDCGCQFADEKDCAPPNNGGGGSGGVGGVGGDSGGGTGGVGGTGSTSSTTTSSSSTSSTTSSTTTTSSSSSSSSSTSSSSSSSTSSSSSSSTSSSSSSSTSSSSSSSTSSSSTSSGGGSGGMSSGGSGGAGGAMASGGGGSGGSGGSANGGGGSGGNGGSGGGTGGVGGTGSTSSTTTSSSSTTSTSSTTTTSTTSGTTTTTGVCDLPQNPPAVQGSCSDPKQNPVPKDHVRLCYTADSGKVQGMTGLMYVHYEVGNTPNGYVDCWDHNGDGLPDAPGCALCPDANQSDSVIECDIPIYPGSNYFQFNVLVAGTSIAAPNYFWCDKASYSEGGCGSLQGTVKLWDRNGNVLAYYRVDNKPAPPPKPQDDNAPYGNGYVVTIP